MLLNSLAAGDDLQFPVFEIHKKAAGFFPAIGHRQFDVFIYGSLQESSPISRTEAFLDQVFDCTLADVELLTLSLHLPLDDVEIKLRDLLDFVLSQRREHDDLVNSIAEF